MGEVRKVIFFCPFCSAGSSLNFKAHHLEPSSFLLTPHERKRTMPEEEEEETEVATLPATAEETADEANDVEAQKPAEDVEEGGGAGGETPEEEKEEISVVTMGVLAACGIMVVLYLIAMGVWGGAVVIVAGLVAIFVGTVVSKFQYFDLEDLDSLRTVQNQLRHSVNTLSSENTKLTANNDRLEAELIPLKESEEKLSQIAEENGSNVEKLTGLVKENQIALDEMTKIQKYDVVQSLMQLLLDVDRNEDGTLSSQEVKRLRMKVKNLPTIDFNEELFERKLKEHQQVSTYLSLVHQVHEEDVPDEERIFKVSTEPTSE
eukprot:scaffold3502_cov111-Cylindrotheca_fusiformis.AAC.5